LFAVQRELAGTREVRVTLPAGATVEGAWGAVVERFPLLAPGRPYLRFALNGDYAEASAPLRDGDEVVFIPPVSGGEETVAPSRRLELTDRAIDDALLAELRAAVAHPRLGGIVTFIGVTYEAHEALARRVLAEIADEVARLHGVRRVAIVHRLGEVPVGETSVAVVTAAAHRGQAFEACRYAIDELKARAPIWKAERFADGSVWIGQPARHGPQAGADPLA
jgi:molybdopterin synthase catalytic subunit